MSYKGVIVKIQKLKAYYDNCLHIVKEEKNSYFPETSKQRYIYDLENFSKELDSLLESEEYSMKKHFKY